MCLVCRIRSCFLPFFLFSFLLSFEVVVVLLLSLPVSVSTIQTAAQPAVKVANFIQAFAQPLLMSHLNTLVIGYRLSCCWYFGCRCCSLPSR